MKAFVKLISVLALFVSGQVFSGQLAMGPLDQVTNILTTEKQFAIKLAAGSTGPCLGWIYVKESSFAGDIAAYNRFFTLATTALIAGRQVRIHNYVNDACDGATFIAVQSS